MRNVLGDNKGSDVATPAVGAGAVNAAAPEEQGNRQARMKAKKSAKAKRREHNRRVSWPALSSAGQSRGHMGRSEEKAGRREWLSAFVDEALTLRSIDYRRLAAALREEIATENIPVGEQLPSQRELARRLGVGRTTVVGAYNVLRSESLVRPRQGAGTWVVGRPDRP
jgi:hypothetical protein